MKHPVAPPPTRAFGRWAGMAWDEMKAVKRKAFLLEELLLQGKRPCPLTLYHFDEGGLGNPPSGVSPENPCAYSRPCMESASFTFASRIFCS